MRLRTLLTSALIAALLSGCAVYPARGYYGWGWHHHHAPYGWRR